MINLHHLHYFYVCAQTGNMTKAAAKLGISQPSLSAQIKQFERHIGIQILARQGRMLALTPRGKELFEHSSAFFQVTDEIERFIRRSEKAKTFDLRIGVSMEVERPFVADVLGRLMKVHSTKKITSTITSGSHDEIVNALAGGDIDVIITNQRVGHAQAVAEFKTPVVLACTDHEDLLRMNASNNVQAALEKLGQTLILPLPEMVLGKETREYLKEHSVQTSANLQSNILACIVRAVEEGVGAAFLPVVYINYQLKKGLLRALGSRDGYWQHTLYLYAEKGSTNEFLEDLVKIIQDLNALV